MENKVYQVPYGTRDILPGEMKMRRRAQDAIIQVFDMWGYEEAKTPGFEYAELFEAAGKDGDFRFFDRRNNLLALRQDMTAPIARLTATRLRGGERVKRLCYLANLYRYEEIQAGRQCEFEQAGVELLGASGAAADAEIIALAVAAFRAAGVENVSLSLGHVGFIDGLTEEAGFTPAQAAQVKECLRRHDAVAMQEIAAASTGMDPKVRQLFAGFVFLQGGAEVGVRVAEMGLNRISLEARANLRRIYDLAEAYGAAAFLKFDLGLYRSLDYYTGMLLEAYLPEMGFPVAGGGRYDRMMNHFGADCPATGFAIGVDRLMLALARRGLSHSRSWEMLVAWRAGHERAAIIKAAQLRSQGHSVKLAPQAVDEQAARAMLAETCCAELVYV